MLYLTSLLTDYSGWKMSELCLYVFLVTVVNLIRQAAFTYSRLYHFNMTYPLLWQFDSLKNTNKFYCSSCNLSAVIGLNNERRSDEDVVAYMTSIDQVDIGFEYPPYEDPPPPYSPPKPVDGTETDAPPPYEPASGGVSSSDPNSNETVSGMGGNNGCYAEDDIREESHCLMESSAVTGPGGAHNRPTGSTSAACSRCPTGRNSNRGKWTNFQRIACHDPGGGSGSSSRGGGSDALIERCGRNLRKKRSKSCNRNTCIPVSEQPVVSASQVVVRMRNNTAQSTLMRGDREIADDVNCAGERSCGASLGLVGRLEVAIGDRIASIHNSIGSIPEPRARYIKRSDSIEIMYSNSNPRNSFYAEFDGGTAKDSCGDDPNETAVKAAHLVDDVISQTDCDGGLVCDDVMQRSAPEVLMNVPRCNDPRRRRPEKKFKVTYGYTDSSILNKANGEKYSRPLSFSELLHQHENVTMSKSAISSDDLRRSLLHLDLRLPLPNTSNSSDPQALTSSQPLTERCVKGTIIRDEAAESILTDLHEFLSSDADLDVDAGPCSPSTLGACASPWKAAEASNKVAVRHRFAAELFSPSQTLQSPESPVYQHFVRSGSITSQASVFSVCSETGEKKRPRCIAVWGVPVQTVDSFCIPSSPSGRTSKDIVSSNGDGGKYEPTEANAPRYDIDNEKELGSDIATSGKDTGIEPAGDITPVQSSVFRVTPAAIENHGELFSNETVCATANDPNSIGFSFLRLYDDEMSTRSGQKSGATDSAAMRVKFRDAAPWSSVDVARQNELGTGPNCRSSPVQAVPVVALAGCTPKQKRRSYRSTGTTTDRITAIEVTSIKPKKDHLPSRRRISKLGEDPSHLLKEYGFIDVPTAFQPPFEIAGTSSVEERSSYGCKSTRSSGGMTAVVTPSASSPPMVKSPNKELHRCRRCREAETTSGWKKRKSSKRSGSFEFLVNKILHQIDPSRTSDAARNCLHHVCLSTERRKPANCTTATHSGAPSMDDNRSASEGESISDLCRASNLAAISGHHRPTSMPCKGVAGGANLSDDLNDLDSMNRNSIVFCGDGYIATPNDNAFVSAMQQCGRSRTANKAPENIVLSVNG